MGAINSGDRAFLLDGREVEYIAAAGALHVVAQVYETDYGDQTGEPFTVEHVYPNPPTEKLHAEVAALTEQTTALRETRHELQREIRDNERATQERLKKLARYKGLELVEDFIEGRITHCVVSHEYDRSVRVLPLAEALKSEGNYDRSLKLLCLYGDSKGDLTWRRSRYSDGSGSGWTEMELFTSEAAANERAGAILTERAATILADPQQPWTAEKVLSSMPAIGMTPPPELVALYEQWRVGAAQAQVEKKRAELAVAETALATLTKQESP